MAELRNTFLSVFHCRANPVMLSKSSVICFRAGDQGAEKVRAGSERKAVTVPGANPRLSLAASSPSIQFFFHHPGSLKENSA